MMREPMFRAEKWGIKEEYPDDDGVHVGRWLLTRGLCPGTVSVLARSLSSLHFESLQRS